MEIVILLLVFGLPILSVILDKNKKKGVPKVKSRPIVWPADKPAAQKKSGSAGTAPAKPTADGSTRPAAAPGPARPTAAAAPARPAATAPEPAPASPSPVIHDAGMAAASYMNETRSTASRAAPAVEEPQEKKKFSEKQKLIIYSEIMKPKFDG